MTLAEVKGKVIVLCAALTEMEGLSQITAADRQTILSVVLSDILKNDSIEVS